MRIALVTAALTLAGCITHLPVRTREHLTIRWAHDWDEAQREAQRLDRPILMCLVAGQIDGPC
jgi:hypothetical protein